jgi:hypothetical protein
MVFLVTFLTLIACGEKKQETASETSSPSHSHSVASDTSLLVQQQDSVDENGKPMPPLPIEEMTREQLAEYKKLLTTKGFYSCCVKPTCRMCLFELEECPCEDNLKKGVGVCGECYEGWQVGKGNVTGIKRQNVKKLQ